MEEWGKKGRCEIGKKNGVQLEVSKKRGNAELAFIDQSLVEMGVKSK